MRNLAAALFLTLTSVACSGQVPSPGPSTPAFASATPRPTPAQSVPSRIASQTAAETPTAVPTQTQSPTPTYDLTLPTLAPWTPYLVPATPEVTDVDGVRWQRVGADALFGFDGMVAWPSNGRWLGAGGHAICPSYCVGEDSWLLESTDAISWSILGKLPSTPEGLGVSETRLGFFAYGTLDGYEPGDHPAMFRSNDGANWNSLSDEPAFAPGKCGSDSRETITSIYETASGLVAEGSSTWFSADGTSWQCLDQPPVFLLRSSPQYVGVRYTDSNDTLWTSDNGLDWTASGRAPRDGTVVAVRHGYVDVPYGDPRVGTYQRVQTSSDGAKWIDAGMPFKPAYVESITSDGNRAAAVDESDPAIWLTPNGSDWTRYVLPVHSGNGYEGDELNSVAFLGDSVLVSGSGAGNRSSAVLWIAHIP